MDTSALFALLDDDDEHHRQALAIWQVWIAQDLVAHSYVVAEAVSLVRRRMGWIAIDALVNRLLPGVRLEMVERDLHDRALAAYLAERGGTSFVDHVTIEFARRQVIEYAFGFDADLVRAGLPLPSDKEVPG